MNLPASGPSSGADSECLNLLPEEIAQDQIACARLLHIDGHDTAAVEHAARLARGHGIPVTVDVDTIYAGFDQVLPYVDYLIASSEFPGRWTGIEDPFHALESIRKRFGMRVAAMTLGAHGALALGDNGFVYSPAFVVNCVDTTGAGDVFHGAFCYAVLQQMPMAEALGFSNAMAALNCTAVGARGGIATLDEARHLLAAGRTPHPSRYRETGRAEMFPLRDDRPTYTAPIVTTLLIVACALVFLHELMLDEYSRNYFMNRYGVVPAHPRLVPLFTSMFLHGGWSHIIGNMLFLWAFGKSLEDAMGHTKFLGFYLSCGFIAAVVQVAANFYSRAPTVGAQRAIAGVMGAYLLKFPRVAYPHSGVHLRLYHHRRYSGGVHPALLVRRADLQRLRFHRAHSGYGYRGGVVRAYRRLRRGDVSGQNDGHARPVLSAPRHLLVGRDARSSRHCRAPRRRGTNLRRHPAADGRGRLSHRHHRPDRGRYGHARFT